MDFDAVRAAIESRLDRAPRYRQKLRLVPLERHPVWIDDPDFNLDYHLRHTSLPRPGGAEQLRRMAARIQSQRLDRARPLWECWVLEGLAGDRFALIVKVHHCMADPAGGSDLVQELLSPDPRQTDPDALSYHPRPAPSAVELVVDEVVQQARLPRRAVERVRAAVSDRERLRHELWARGSSLARRLGYTLRGPRETPLNGRTGPHRRFDHRVFPLADARAIHSALGGTVHDVILATVAGAVRSFLEARYVNPATLDFRVATPVQVAPEDSEPRGSGEVVEWVVDLPVWERDPAKRLALIQERTAALQEECEALGAHALFDAPEWNGSRLLALGARAITSFTPVNLTVVNVPGPQVPLYFRGAALIEAYGQVPLRHRSALGISVLSYDGKLCWGLNGDFDLLPDLPRFSAALEASFTELTRAAGAGDRHLSVVGD